MVYRWWNSYFILRKRVKTMPETAIICTLLNSICNVMMVIGIWIIAIKIQ